MPDVRPISADWLKMTFEEDFHVDFVRDIGGAKIAMIPYRTVMEVIDAAPTIDAQPVKYGKWETKGGVHCTRCGWRPTGRICDLFTDYCAGCGAKMDGDADER